jgi:cytosine/adenosine deaminase-related metal-dependent hydrolase
MCLERGRYEDATVYNPDQVLRQATIDGARALSVAALTGSLRPGKKADLILMRADALNIAPLNVPAGQIVLAAQPRNIDSVWVDGIARKRGGELLGMDIPGLARDVKEAVAGLSRRIGKDVV